MRVQSALVASEHAAQSQVGNLELAPAADEEVGGLEISVHYAVVVQVRSALGGGEQENNSPRKPSRNQIGTLSNIVM